jgi:hypothetical protein
MEKRMILAIVLSVAVLLAYQYLIAESAGGAARNCARRDG